MKCGIMLICTGTPRTTSPEDVREYTETVLGTGLYTEGIGIVQRQLYERVTIPAKARAWRRHFDDDAVIETYRANAESLRERLSAKLADATRKQCVVTVGMRCGSPSLADAAGKLAEERCDVVLLLPLYPLRFPPMVIPALAKAKRAIEEVGGGSWKPRLIEMDSFCRTPGFVQAIAQRIGSDWEPKSLSRLLILMPSEPRELARQDGAYEEQINWLAERLSRSLKINPSFVQVSFVCEFDNKQWLGPFAEKTLIGWAGGGVRDVKAVCPAFCMADPLGVCDAGAGIKRFFEANTAGRPTSYDFVEPFEDLDELAGILCDAVTRKI